MRGLIEIAPSACTGSGDDIGSDRWWAAIAERGTPLRSGGLSSGGNGKQTLTFYWRQGPAQATAAVFIDIYSHTPHPVAEGPTTLTRCPGTDVWQFKTTLPKDWCGSYFLVPVSARDLPVPQDKKHRRHWWLDLLRRCAVCDPLNRIAPHNGAWGQPLSGIYEKPPKIFCADNYFSSGPNGRLTSSYPKSSHLQNRQWKSVRLKNTRQIWRCRLGSAPVSKRALVILLDGHYWAEREELLGELSQRCARRELPSADYLLIDALNPEVRAQELPCSKNFWLAVIEELLTPLQQRGEITNVTEKILVAGQSYGGLAAVYGALNWPQKIGAVLSQSGSFWWSSSDAQHSGGEIGALLRAQALPADKQETKPRFLLEVGRCEGDMLADNRAVRDALSVGDYPVHYREFTGGHDWLCWRRSLVDGIDQLLNHAE